MSATIYRHGDEFIAVRTGMPTDAAELGLGATPEEAVDDLYATPIGSCGADPEGAVLEWAWSSGCLGEIRYEIVEVTS